MTDVELTDEELAEFAAPCRCGHTLSQHEYGTDRAPCLPDDELCGCGIYVLMNPYIDASWVSHESQRRVLERHRDVSRLRPRCNAREYAGYVSGRATWRQCADYLVEGVCPRHGPQNSPF